VSCLVLGTESGQVMVLSPTANVATHHWQLRRHVPAFLCASGHSPPHPFTCHPFICHVLHLSPPLPLISHPFTLHLSPLTLDQVPLHYHWQLRQHVLAFLCASGHLPSHPFTCHPITLHLSPLVNIFLFQKLHLSSSMSQPFTLHP